jgi:curved DNA-binding protein CbpA
VAKKKKQKSSPKQKAEQKLAGGIGLAGSGATYATLLHAGRKSHEPIINSAAKTVDKIKGSDPYETLGVSRDATEDQIKKASREASKKFHPDLHPNDPAAATEFQKHLDAANRIKLGNDALSDTERADLEGSEAILKIAKGVKIAEGVSVGAGVAGVGLAGYGAKKLYDAHQDPRPPADSTKKPSTAERALITGSSLAGLGGSSYDSYHTASGIMGEEYMKSPSPEQREVGERLLKTAKNTKAKKASVAAMGIGAGLYVGAAGMHAHRTWNAHFKTPSSKAQFYTRHRNGKAQKVKMPKRSRTGN